MAHQVTWTKKIIEEFIELAYLSEDEATIMRTRAQGWTVSRQAAELNKSESSVHQMIKNLKMKYDVVQREHPDKFPKRQFSAKEKYMDTH